MKLSAVLFDFDGVLVDTERLHWGAVCEAIRPLDRDIQWEAYLATLVGFNDRETFEILYREWGVDYDETNIQFLIDAKARAFADQVDRGVQLYPGVDALVRALAGCVPVAVCSGASRADIEVVLARVDLDGLFDVIIAGDEVRCGKPDPEGYRLAIDRLSGRQPDAQLEPARCVAVEDTPTGILAARAAGTKVLAVTNTFSDTELSEATWIVNELSGMTPAALATMLNRLPD